MEDRNARLAKAGEGDTGNSRSAASVTPGQERLILGAFEAGLTPAAIAREFRLARATVQQVVAAARHDRQWGGATDSQALRQNG